MSKIITVNDLNSSIYYQLPKAFFHNPLYKDMKNESKIAYALLRDLLELSIENNWVNENNEVYVKFSRVKMMKYLNIKGTAKHAEIMNELISKDLIVKRKVGPNKCDEIYICIPDELDIIYSDKELLELDENKNKDDANVVKSMRFEKQTTRSLKNKPLEVRKSNLMRFENQTHTKTNITKTNITKTNITTQSEIACSIEEQSNIDLIESKTHLKLSANQVKKIAAWDKQRLKTAINIFKNNDGKYFALLEKIYKDDCNFAPSNKNNKVDNFNNFQQRQYDYDDLEKKLLEAQYNRM